MPTFSFTAKNKKGQNITGTIEAANQHELAKLLGRDGLLLISSQVISVKKGLKLDSFVALFKRVSLVERMMFTRHLAVMLKAGLSINQSLKALSRQARNPYFKKIIIQIDNKVHKGEPLSVALSAFPKVFNELYINMIQVGETSGNVDEVLINLANQMKKDHDLVSRIRGAMIYPALIIVTLIGIGITSMIVVVPKLTAIFTELNTELPFTTRIIIGTSNFMKEHFIIGASILIGIIIIFRLLIKVQEAKKILHRVYLYFPVIGDLIKKINSARFSRTLSSLIESGVDIVKALNITANTLGNIQFKNALIVSAKEVQKGNSLAKTLTSYEKIFSPMVIEMTQVGEETGDLSGILENLADFFEEEIDQTTKNLSALIEPIIMIIIGSAIGFFAVAMLQPMYSMMQGL